MIVFFAVYSHASCARYGKISLDARVIGLRKNGVVYETHWYDDEHGGSSIKDTPDAHKIKHNLSQFYVIFKFFFLQGL